MIVASIISLGVTLSSPVVSDESQLLSYKRTVKADIAVLEHMLDKIIIDPESNRGYIETSRSILGMLLSYAEILQDNALKSQVIKVSQLFDSEHWKQAALVVTKLSNPELDASVLTQQMRRLTAQEIGRPFLAARKGPSGLNIEADLKAQRDNISDVRKVEVLGVRTAVLAKLKASFPPQIGEKQFDPASWKMWAVETSRIGDELAAEARKEGRADKSKLQRLLTRLDSSCTRCHDLSYR